MELGQLASLVLGVMALAFTFIIVIWTRAAQRAYSAPGDAVSKRSPVGLLITGVLTAAVCFVGAFVPSDAVAVVLIVAFVVAVFAYSYAASYARFWAADSQGLTQQALGFKKTLPWQSIDWVYPARNTTTYRAYGIIKVGSATVDSMMVEAGPKKRTKIIIAARRGIRSMKRQGSEALLSAIQQRATNAIFGFDKYPQVRERRAQMGFPQR